jgi:hypothetical protein
MQVNSGIEAVGPVQWGTHFCQFYETADDLVDTLVPFFKAGLDSNERCMWVTAHPLRAHEPPTPCGTRCPIWTGGCQPGRSRSSTTTDGTGPARARPGADEVIAGWLRRKDEALERGYGGFRLTGNTYFLEAATGTASPSTRRR